MTLTDYLPIAIMFFLAMAFAGVALVLSRLVSPHNPTPEKLEPYECGIVPLQEPVQRFPVKFYLVAMLFVIFWAVRFHTLGWPGVAAVGLFTLLLIETLIYVWRRGALDWNIPRRDRYRRVVAPEITEEAA